MADRGDYSPIARVLRDGPDFQQLSTPARHIFIDLKIAFGPCGIEVKYPDALASEVSHTTGYAVSVVRDALDELEAADWIARERNVLWIIEHLQYHPNMSPKNPKHRAGVQAYVRGLPRIALVSQFVAHYRAFFASPAAPSDDTIPPQDPHGDGGRIPDADAAREGEGDDAPHVAQFTASHHRHAYVTLRGAAQNPLGLDHAVRFAADGGELPGGGMQRAFGWTVVGEALHEISLKGGPVTRRALQTFCEAVLLGSASEAGQASRAGIGRTPDPIATRARTLLAVFRRYAFLSFTPGVKGELQRKLELAQADPDAGPDFAAELMQVKPWEGLNGLGADRWIEAEIVRRLQHRPAEALSA